MKFLKSILSFFKNNTDIFMYSIYRNLFINTPISIETVEHHFNRHCWLYILKNLYNYKTIFILMVFTGFGHFSSVAT